MRYDAAIIGAGANGLAAASALAGAGLKVIVLERGQVCGGRAVTREFHPGFRASPFRDELAAIPADIFRALDFARRGAIFMPTRTALVLWPDRKCGSVEWPGQSSAEIRLRDAARTCAADIQTRAFADASHVPERRWFGAAPLPPAWPGEAWSRRALTDMLEEWLPDADSRARVMAATLDGRPADPFAVGSALHLLAPASGGSGVAMGGLATLAEALATAARAVGAEISLGLEVSEIRLDGRRAARVSLADGTEIAARAVISSLDFKRTFFSLFAWKDLPAAIAKRTTAFRYAGGTARLLLALDEPPPIEALHADGPIFVAPDASAFAVAHAAWRSGSVPERIPISLRLISATDPRLAPPGKAVLTATLGCIPHHLFDGPWTHQKRDALRERALSAIESVLPGTATRVLAAELIVPSDIEEALGSTGGDLDGGEIAPDQMFGRRGFLECEGGRTPITGLYLGGPSAALGPLATCASGVAAARALLADLRAGHLT